MNFVPNLPRDELTTIVNADGDSALGPKGSEMMYTADGDRFAAPQGSLADFSPDGDMHVEFPDGRKVEYFTVLE
jgi:hypothetical protein